MSFRLVVRHLAEADIAEAFDWYESQQEGLGNRFLEAVDDLFETIEQQPFIYSIRYRDIRWAFAVPFPYKAIYYVEQESIVVIGVIHGSRHSRIWKHRLR
ncbi:MAG: type II toxin-antitoxin system RelE/ParE family toxin [Acidobacteria bacterium]|nr:type II toxin-antitoxin system RelE/ParE family toxin [Acidobacteriota bacterium]MCI0626588.1 type II toxin-antitoxin system RelE/ParE family toxin [Acidobacteriota bacterium]MCI0721189.1 type II toxin-antitoxin system RelE/ParE family toxin [Acidobacteriota bacterium]